MGTVQEVDVRRHRNIDTTPPKSEEFELSIFGPGVGECILLHFGDGNWAIVDSCIDARTQEQPALAYLHSMGFDPAQSVRLVCATHFHTDHVRGLSRVVSECESATFYCSAASSRDEFFNLLGTEAVSTGHASQSAMAEFRAVLDVLEKRAIGRPAVPPIKYAIADRTIYESARPHEVKIVALAPSDDTVTMAREHLSSLLPRDGEEYLGFPARQLNDLSVVLLVKCGRLSALLGGDLEVTGHPSTGWSGVLSAAQDELNTVDLHKVPHHGSVDGHKPDVWRDLLVGEPVAVLAPYRPSGLPTENDIRRICSLSSDAFTTTPRESDAPRGLSRSERLAMERCARNIQELSGVAGHVRLRQLMTANDGWMVDLKRPSRSLC